MKTIDLDALPAEAWRPSQPMTGRASNRVSERELERVPAWISFGEAHGTVSTGNIPVKLWDYSPFGFAVLFPLGDTGYAAPKIGAFASLKLDLGSGILAAECIVKNTAVQKNGLRIGLSRRDLARRRKSECASGGAWGESIRVPDSLEIRAEAQNPILFAEWASFRLGEVRPGLLMDFICQDPGLPLFMGQKLDLRLSLPTSGKSSFSGEIVSLERVPGNSLKARIRPLSVSSALANEMAEMLAFAANISPGALKRFGFPIRFLRNRVTFRFLENMDEYAQVLALRRSAYVEAGKKNGGTRAEEMSLSKDRNSRILCAYHEETLVACAAITFPSRPDDVLRSESSFPDGKYPIPHPPKMELLEVNSLCTHREYRRGDLLQSMFEQIARIFVLSGRTCILNLVETALLPVYIGIGFRDTRQTCTFLGRVHHLIRIDRNVVTEARHLGLLRWNLLYGDLMEDILRKEMLPMTVWARNRLRLRLVLKPYAKRWIGVRYENAFRRTLEEMEKNEIG